MNHAEGEWGKKKMGKKKMRKKKMGKKWERKNGQEKNGGEKKGRRIKETLSKSFDLFCFLVTLFLFPNLVFKADGQKT